MDIKIETNRRNAYEVYEIMEVARLKKAQEKKDLILKELEDLRVSSIEESAPWFERVLPAIEKEILNTAKSGYDTYQVLLEHFPSYITGNFNVVKAHFEDMGYTVEHRVDGNVLSISWANPKT